MAIEQRLKELKGSSRLALGFFNSLIRRIECTKPIAGSGVSIVEKPDGIEINAFGAFVNGKIGDFTSVTINVCSNGTPSQLIVLAKPLPKKE